MFSAINSTLIIPDNAMIIDPSYSVGYQQINVILSKTVPSWSVEDRMQFAGNICTICSMTGISDILFLSQVWKETGEGTSDRFLKSNNPAGLGAINDGSWGNEFPTRIAGLCAMAGHLINYAVKDGKLTKMQRCFISLDPRLNTLIELKYIGIAPFWVDLWQKWGVIDPKKAKIPPKMSPEAYGMSIIVRARRYATL